MVTRTSNAHETTNGRHHAATPSPSKKSMPTWGEEERKAEREGTMMRWWGNLGASWGKCAKCVLGLRRGAVDS